MQGFRLWMIAVLAVGPIAGCSAMNAPPRPAMVALDSNGDYGFSETKLADDAYQVRYIEPRLQVSIDRAARQAAIEAAKQRSYDLALWRAAELATAQGYAAVQVTQDRRDADVDVSERHYRRVSPFIGFGYYSHPLHGHRPWFPYHYDAYPYYPYYPYEGDYFEREAASARVSVTLTVKFLREPAEGAQDATATATELKQRYANTTFPPAR